MGINDNVCEEHEEAAARRGVEASMHCCHSYDREHDICCWCGHLFVPVTDDPRHHGQYKDIKGGRRG